MDFPFIGKKKEKIEELEEKIDVLKSRIEEIEGEKDSYKKRYQSEKKRRSELSTEKQEAQKELNKLKQKLGSQNPDQGVEKDSNELKFEEISLKDVKDVLSKLESIQSNSRDMVTVYSEGDISEVRDFRGLKNTLDSDQLEFVDINKPCVAYIDDNLFRVLIKTRPFLNSEWKLSEQFETENLTDFIEREKNWVVVSAGESLVIREKNGQILEKQEVKSRVDRKHTQGGFSQKRFERKREEQIKEHISELEKKLPDEEYYLLGDRKLCKKLDSDYFGGFDDNRPLIDSLYGFQILREQG